MFWINAPTYLNFTPHQICLGFFLVFACIVDFFSLITNTGVCPLCLAGWGILMMLSCLNLSIYCADSTVCLVVALPRGAVVLVCLEKAQFVVLSRARFSLPALLVPLPATLEAHPPTRRKENAVLIS